MMEFRLHAGHREELRRVTLKLAVLAALLLLLRAIEIPAQLRGFAGYAPLHTLLETFAIVVAGLIFAIGWNARRSHGSAALVLLACAFAGVAILDLSHMLSFQGMPAYVTPSDPEKAINFWLAARLLAAGALLVVVNSAWTPLTAPATRHRLLAGVLLLVALAHWLFLYHPQQMPRTFIAGEGLTTLKIGAEYLIIGLNLLAAATLLWRMRAPLPFNANALLGTVLTMAMSEFFFTLYADVTDVFNITGHVYKVISYLFLYRAVFLEAVERPYQALDATQNSLKATLRAVPDLVFEMDLDGRYRSYHSPRSDLLAAAPEALIGRRVQDVLPRAAAEVVMAVLREAAEHGSASGHLMTLALPQGQRWFELSAARKAQAGGEAPSLIVLSRDITSRHQSEQQLKLLGAAIAKLNDIVLITEAEPIAAPGPRIVFVNEAFERRTGYSRDEVMGKTPRILQGPHTKREELARIRAALEQWQPVQAELLNYTKSGEEFWVELTIAPIANEAGWFTHWVAVQRDVSERRRARDALRATVQHTQAILDNMADGVITIGPDGLIRSFSKAASAIFGYRPEQVMGRNVSLLMPEPPRSQHDGFLLRHLHSGDKSIIGALREVEGLRQDGSVFPMSLSITETSHQGQTTFIGLVRDITQRRAVEEEIRRLAYYDGLTGLPNRRLLSDHLQHALQISGRSAHHGALMFLDLDHFKQINDTLGHVVGDQLLRLVAQRLQISMREGDTVARLGGDEFVLVLEGLSQQREEAVHQAEEIAHKVLNLLAQPYWLAGKQHLSSTSIGIVLFLRDGKSIDDLLKEADAALYQAKAAGRNTFCFFDPAMQAAAVARNELEEDMRHGLAQHEFTLFFQIQVDGAGQGRGVEALVRWNKPGQGLVSPARFIPMAEETGLILPLGQWVLETACAQLSAWASHPLTAHFTVAVNVSAKQFAQPEFVELVEHALQKTGARPELLKLELTESALAANVDDIVLKMNAIKARGVSFSLDDFGTGYSSLSYLKRLPLDQLKIDQSFVRDLLSDPNDATIARTIVSLGHSLGLKVIAEGVETQGQRDFLEAIGCDAYQGYFFGRPLPSDDLLAALARRTNVLQESMA